MDGQPIGAFEITLPSRAELAEICDDPDHVMAQVQQFWEMARCADCVRAMEIALANAQAMTALVAEGIDMKPCIEDKVDTFRAILMAAYLRNRETLLPAIARAAAGGAVQ